MEFSEFANKIASVIRGGSSIQDFTRTLFDAITNENGNSIVEKYSDSSYKLFYNGDQLINDYAKKISLYVDPMEFSDFINEYDDSVAENLCVAFKEEFPEANQHNIAELLAKEFQQIIITAAQSPSKRSQKDISSSEAEDAHESDDDWDAVPHFSPLEEVSEAYSEPFNKYLSSASRYYSTKKTLLYAEKPYPFYDMYVCNDIICFKNISKGEASIHLCNATVKELETVSQYIVIEGTGGIGKSMFLNHLFLSANPVNYFNSRVLTWKDYEELYQLQKTRNDRIPIYIPLKDYQVDSLSLVEFITAVVREFEPTITMEDVQKFSTNKKLILLLDGLDEVRSDLRDSFDKALNAYIKAYPENSVIITSRPIDSFVSYSKFTVFDIQPLSKEQAITLVTKLDYWDQKSKEKFLKELDDNLYIAHRDFASNPLLLTIMLMTYSSFAEIPAKVHIFYAKAYETMSRLHDATKGSYKRPLHTKLTPEDFAKFFSQFCARTYKDQKIEFDYPLFDKYMSKVISKTDIPLSGVSTRDFLLDLTDNLCIMYCEGEKYYFIHRSFQEYFAAVYFSSMYDEELIKVGQFFDKPSNNFFSDKTFDMLYDMESKKIDRFVFLPYLKNLFDKCDAEDEYFDFLDRTYGYFYFNEGNSGLYVNIQNSYIYRKLVMLKGIYFASELNRFKWPDEIYEMPTREYVIAYSAFLTEKAFDDYPDPNSIDEELLEHYETMPLDDLPSKYIEYFGEPDVVGKTIEICIYDLQEDPDKYPEIRKVMLSDDFPMMREYKRVKELYEKLKKQATENASDSLFDD